MTAAALITLRETLEASLIVGIVLACLARLHEQRGVLAVWLGVAAGIAGSILFAAVIWLTTKELSGRAEEIYEGTTMLVGAALLTWMILWMMRQSRTIKKHIEAKVERHIEQRYLFGIFFLTMVSVGREGVETVLFLQATAFHLGQVTHLFGGILGIVAAIVIAVLLFRGIRFFSLRQFFSVTSALLMLFAAGLVAHGLHEFIEAGLLPPLIEHVWDTSVILSEQSIVGTFLKTLLGYNADPSLLEVLGVVAYVSVTGILWRYFITAAQPPLHRGPSY
jgi:high-affinity iron transporter